MKSRYLEFQREFFKLAGFMLLSRYQLMNGRKCTEVRGHASNEKLLLFMQLSYVGYADSKGEMKMLCEEYKYEIRHCCQ
jgi:hypothetical protein